MKVVLMKLTKKLLLLFCISHSYLYTRLSEEQQERIAYFQQELALINASAQIEWTNNEKVESLIDDIERTLQIDSSHNQRSYKKAIKKIFQRYNINITFSKQNWIQKLSDDATLPVDLDEENEISPQALEQPIDLLEYIYSFTTSPVKSFDYPSSFKLDFCPTSKPHLSNNCAFWKKYLSRKAKRNTFSRVHSLYLQPSAL